MSTVSKNIANNKVHPHKFAMWLAIGSMIMFFAGLTSAYLVHKSKGSWNYFNVPTAFWYSTLVILASSVTMWMAVKAMKAKDLTKYRVWLTVTTILGFIFITLQLQGFDQLSSANIQVSGQPSDSLFYIIPMLHGLHVLGGIVALVVLTLQSYFSKNKSYNLVPVQVVATYWHFVDLLWLYLFIFFILTQQLKVI